MKKVKSIWIFDVDGVIAHPAKKKNTEPQILNSIAEKLQNCEPVALNTGRSLVWLIDRIIKPILQRIKNKNNLKYFFASGEKGAMWITFGKNGQINVHKDFSISVPASLQQKAKNLIESEFSESMFFDKTKETMISIEMKDDYSIEKYSKQQKILIEKLKTLINQENTNKELKLDPTIVATDIENKHVGKGFAVERILKWLNDENISPQKYVTFGDSLSDLPMPSTLHKRDKNVEFVFVGKNIIDSSYPFPIIHTKEKYEKGTLEYIKSL